MSRLIYRDSFARFELHRATVFNASHHDNATCSWCGGVKETKKGRKFLYIYWTEPDSILSCRNYFNGLYGLFCSASCCRNYNGGE
jgi:hypothetical protein